jgi:hypothetical protein
MMKQIVYLSLAYGCCAIRKCFCSVVSNQAVDDGSTIVIINRWNGIFDNIMKALESW